MQSPAELAWLQAVPGERHWFWLTDANLEQVPDLLVVLTDDDPEGRTFGERVASRRAEASLQREVYGLLDVAVDGALTFRSHGDGAEILGLLDHWVEGRGQDRVLLDRLAGARVQGPGTVEPVSVTSGSVLSTLAPADRPGASLALGTAAQLRKLDPGDRLFFWLFDLSDEVVLLLANEAVTLPVFTGSLKGLASTYEGLLGGVGGLAHVEVSGALTLTSRVDLTAKLPGLVRWVRRYLGLAPALASIRAARFVQEGPAGAVDRTPDPTTWEGLSAGPMPADYALLGALGEILERAQPGSRFWFRFVPDSRVRPGQLELSTAAFERGEGAYVGPCQPRKGGGFEFESTEVDARFLERLARFIGGNRKALPALDRLLHSVCRGPGTEAWTHAPATLWDGVG